MEKPPKVNRKEIVGAIGLLYLKKGLATFVDKINEDYEYWDKVKYKEGPNKISKEDLWKFVKADRLRNSISVQEWSQYGIHFGLTGKMMQRCHEFDMNYGGTWETDATVPSQSRERYLVSSLMEEAISSSQMEGASTTRKIAKEMLRKGTLPKDRSQQMIYNNYQTILFLAENKNRPLTEDLLLEVHKMMTEKTLNNAEDAGRFRQTNDVMVLNAITREVVHRPPSYKDLPEFVETLCRFFNATESKPYIHPIIRGIIIHFMVAYVHPFVDGNGRTARALFYWYMLKQGYGLMEYLSISRVIYKAKTSYEKAFLYAEADGNDIGYFIAYNLRVLDLAFKELQAYIKRKIEERQAAFQFLHIGNINERQAEVIKLFYDNPHEMLMVKDLQARFSITAATAKIDLVKLVDMGILKEVALNKKARGYVRGERFEEVNPHKS